MVAVYSENLRVYNAEQFIKSVSDVGPTNIYLTFGKQTPWANDSVPVQANSSVSAFNEVWKNMIGAKLISGNDIRHAIQRFDWTANTSYAAYDDCLCSILMYRPNVKFYAVTTDWNVYKCLSNSRSSVSTVMPTQTKTDAAVEESDGYIWKYMYTVSAEERLRFTTQNYIPVKTLTVDNNSLQWQVQQNAIEGGIEAIKVLNVGSGYTNPNAVSVIITGDGSGATAVASVNTASNTISKISVTSTGTGYTYADVTISSANGSGAIAKAAISPPRGHGSDPVRELGGSYIILNPRINNIESGKLPIDNEFRQIAIIQDPVVKSTSNIATNSVYSQVYTLTLDYGTTDYVEDEIVYQGSTLDTSYFRGTVVAWDSANSIVRLSNTVGTPQTDPLVGANSAASRYVTSATDKQLKDYSGNLLYINNIAPIQRAIDQTEDFKIVIEF